MAAARSPLPTPLALPFLFLFLSIHTLSASAAFSPANRIIVVTFSGLSLTDVLKDSFFLSLSQDKCSRLYGRYFAVSPLIQPNGISLISGSSHNVDTDNYTTISSDCSFVVCGPTSARTVVDVLDDNYIPWKVYAENYPGSIAPSQIDPSLFNQLGCGDATPEDAVNMCYSNGGCFFGYRSPDPAVQDQYLRTYLPFLSFTSFTDKYSRCKRIVDDNAFWSDADNNTLPNFVYYIPNTCNSAHGTYVSTACTPGTISQASSFFQGFLQRLKNSATFANQRAGEGTVVLAVFLGGDTTPIKKQVYAIAHGCGVVTPPSFQLNCDPNVFDCDGSTSQAAEVYPECYSTKGTYGAGFDINCGPGRQYDYRKISSSYASVDGLTVDMSPYSHFSTLALIRRNWELPGLWTPADAAQPLRLTDDDDLP